MMEVKILCPCGSKFKFDVEPVNGRLPVPVSCPTCGVDATAQANEIIQASLPSTPAQPAPPPAAAPAPAETSPGLRITRQAEPAAPAPFATTPARPSPPAFTPSKPAASSSGEGILQKLKTVGIVILAILGVAAFCMKWYRRLHLAAVVVSTVSSNSGTPAGSDSEGAKNLWYEDCAVVFVNHSDQMEIANACKEIWKNEFKTDLTVENGESDSYTAGQFILVPAHNGYVRIFGAHEWHVSQQEALTKFLSQKFSCLAFEWRSEHFADTYHFGVYDQGERKFHAQMDVNMAKDAEEVVTTVGDDYARANGFNGGAKGFKEFNVLDADKITRHLGMKLWDEKDGTTMKGLVMKAAR